jgi:SprT protein
MTTEIQTVTTPEDMQQLMRDCIRVTHEWIDTVNKKWGLKLPYYKVVFGLKSGTAGRAKLGEGIIQYNPTLLRENPSAFLARTPGHEVVHFANWLVHPLATAHGPEWKRMMRELGLPDTRCHNYDTAHVPTKVFKVRQKPKVFTDSMGQIRMVSVGKVIEFD